MIKKKIRNRVNYLVDSILLFILIKTLNRYMRHKGNIGKWHSVEETNKKVLNTALKTLEYERNINNKYK